MSKPRLLDDPLYCPGAYSFDAYCKYENDEHEWSEFPHSFIAETGGQARSQAKRKGWLIHRDGTATCPKCARLLSKGEK